MNTRATTEPSRLERKPAPTRHRRQLARLRFPRELEARFMAASAQQRMRQFCASGLIALLVYNAFLLADWLLVPDVFALDLVLRLCVMTPASLFGLWLVSHRRAFCLKQPSWFIEAMTVASGVLAAATLGIVLAVTDSPVRTLCHAGFLPMLVYGNTVQRLRFRYALLLSAGVMAIHLAVILSVPASPIGLTGPMILMNGSAACLTLVSNYDLEYQERQRFLLRNSEAALLNQLNESHVQLEALSRCDALTGLANRRHVDAYLQAQRRPADEGPCRLALLLLDVDHFKAYNDHHGHPAGDECLRQVAHALSQQLPAEHGLVARWGGEEFLVLLPHASESQAQQLGEAMRAAVQALGLRHDASPVAPCVTASVGWSLGTAPPAAQDGSDWIDELLVRADQALYEAKRRGRNGVAPSSSARAQHAAPPQSAHAAAQATPTESHT